MFDFKMPTGKSYIGNDIGSRMARHILDTRKNYRNMGNVQKSKLAGATKGRNKPRKGSK